MRPRGARPLISYGALRLWVQYNQYKRKRASKVFVDYVIFHHIPGLLAQLFHSKATATKTGGGDVRQPNVDVYMFVEAAQLFA